MNPVSELGHQTSEEAHKHTHTHKHMHLLSIILQSLVYVRLIKSSHTAP